MRYRPLERLSVTTLRALAMALLTLSLALAAATVLLGERAEHVGFLPISFYVANAQRPIILLAMIFYALLGGLLTFRLPRFVYGWLWSWLALTLIFIEFARWYTAYNLFVVRGALPLMHLLAWLATAAWITTLVQTAFLMLLFPDGRLPSPRWRLLGWTLVALAIVATLAELLAPGMMRIVPLANPFSFISMRWEPTTARVANFAIAALGVGNIAAGASVFVRLRRAQGVERQQIKWFAFAAALLGLFLALTPLLQRLHLRQYWFDVLGAAIISLLALAMAVAVLRYRLYDIDLLIRRTLAYSVVTLLLGVLYLGMVIASQNLLVQRTGQTSQLAVVLSTLAIATLFNPLRLRVQDWIDQRFFRAKYDAQWVLEAFSATVRDETDPEQLRLQLEAVLRDTLQPTAVNIWLRRSDTRDGS